MYPERKNTLWRKITSLAVLTAIAAGCAPKTMGYVTPTPEGGTTPAADLYCDNHMLTYAPEMGLNELDPNKLPIISESLVGPSGVGRITDFNIVENPTSEFISNVKRSAQEQKHSQNIDIAVDKSTVVEFGMQGEDGDLCAPFTMILGEPLPDGTQKAYVGFGVEQIDANGDGNPDLEVLIPPFGGDVDRFMEIGQVDTNPSDSLVHLGTVDTLDPQSISPLFTVDEKTGAVTFIPPFYQGDGQPQQPEVQVSAEGANFVNVSFNPDGNNTPPPDDEVTATPKPVEQKATTTPTTEPTQETKQYPICGPENYKDCVIPYEDLFNGNYVNWLNTIPVQQFDPTKVNTIQCAGSSNGIIFFGGPNTNNFGNPETSRLRRGATYGTTTVKPGELGNTFAVDVNYLVLPVYAYSETNKSGVWIPLVMPTPNNMTEGQIQEFIARWSNSGNLMVVAIKNFSAVPSSPEDPLVANSFKLVPDLQSRLDDFRVSCDPKALSVPGVVLETSATQ